MAKPKTPHGDSPDAPRPHGDGEGDGDAASPGRRRGTEVPENVGRAQETIADEARQGRPGGDQGGTPGRPGGDGGYQPPKPGTPEYDARVQELAADPAHNGKISAKSRREAEVGLEAEAQGKIPGPIRRAELDNSDPAFQKDQGEFIDGNGDNWDVKSPVDTFPAGRQAGQPMPEGTRGRYDGNETEQKLSDEVAGGQRVIIDSKNLSPGSLADLKRRVAGNPDLDGKVVFLE
ncbi:hypothetical protein [Micromonospora sp. NPDC049282]|uniref:hypothetical protein n=1 Tax=Micromonospora sp. NPDC049282 TaxID=3364269 RepID=UPI003723A48B